ncbi:MAG: hydrogenase formation protein HypD, partial [Thiovulaceae bacterium]|nr:hydrogenase formation protein HypD [Sulfurimonadaceae bacterium]
ARAKGADVRFVYSPMDTLQIAKENPHAKVVFFAIGFETTTPMSAALLESVIAQKIPNVFFHVNHVSVPEPMRLLLEDSDSKIDAFLGPSHVSVISGSKIYEEFPKKYKKPVVVSGFEPVDVMESIYKIVKQFVEGRCELEVEYTRAVTREGNTKAQELVAKYFQKAPSFRWRGLGDIPYSSLQLRQEYGMYDAEVLYKDILPQMPIEDHKLCICAEILKGKAIPTECSVFGTACKPSSPLGSCMVSSEGACAAYFKFGKLI